MAAPTNTVTTLVAVGNREDLENTIYRVAAQDTPLVSNIGTVTATLSNHEWQTSTLATPDETNAALEGDDVGTLNAGNLSTRVGNKTQIFTKSFGVSGTEEVVNKAGRASEIAWQTVNKTMELKTDEEKRFIGNYASNAQSGPTPRRAGSLLSWLTSNVSRGSGGSSGGFSGGDTAAATNGTQRTFTEALVKTVLSSAFNNGARPSVGYMSGTHKQAFSAFTGIADIRVDAQRGKMANIVAGADIYTSDFGNITLTPHPYGLTRDAVFIDPDKLAVGVLRGLSKTQLAKNGDSDRFQLIRESTLVVRNEKSHAVVADLT